jgi:hypothetical protein
LRRHANKPARVHQALAAKRHDGGRRRSGRGQSNGAGREINSSSATPSDDSHSAGTNTTASGPPNATVSDEDKLSLGSRGFTSGTGVHNTKSSDFGQFQKGALANSSQPRGTNRQSLNGDDTIRPPAPSSRYAPPTDSAYPQQQQVNYANQIEQEQQNHSDGIYRVPESRTSFGTRYMAVGNGQQQIWSTSSYVPGGGGGSGPSPSAVNGLFNQRDYKANEHHGNYNFHGYYQQGGHPHANGSPGMPATNQMTTVGDAQGGGGQRQQQHRPQPATISVNGKQLYC